MTVRSASLVMLLLLAICWLMPRIAAADPSLRTTTLLDGADWQSVQTREDQQPTQGWSAATVPAIKFVTPDWKPQYLWYRRTLAVPMEWAGRRVFVTIGGARNAPQVYVNGKLAGGQLDGWTPLRVEITSLVTPGAAATLGIRCQDRTATVMPEKLASYAAGADASKASTIAPIGGYHDLMGVWDSVRLETTPQDEIVPSELVITPLVRKQMLTLHGSIDSKQGDLWVSARVIEAGGSKTALEMPGAAVAADGTWQFSQAFPNAHDWSPEDPYRYSLELTLHQGSTTGPVLDAYTQLFGFKEIWIIGPDFYINGVKRHLLATATWPNADPMPPDQIRERVKSIKDSNAVCFRLHTGPWREEWLNAADELGLLVVDEAAIYTDGDGIYAYNDPRFWKNYHDHIAGMIRRDRNHPSLALYSLENETLFMGNQKYDAKLPDQFGDTANFARGIDPAHPITFEADRDPGGGADVIGLHYPHEPPGHVDYPNTCDWLGGGTISADALGGMLGTTSGEFSWDRKKPLYIGEYLWDPQGDFSVASIFYGDEAYQNRDKYHLEAQKKLFYEQTVAYRRSGVSGMCPWTTFEFGYARPANGLYENQQEFYRPVAAFLRDYGLRCFAGETRTLTYDVFNDCPSAKMLTLSLMNAKTKAVVATRHLSLDAGGYQPVQFVVTIPPVKTPTVLHLVSLLDDGTGTRQRKVFALSVTPRMALTIPKGVTMIAYDPNHAWPNSVATLSGLANANVPKTVLVITPHALDVAQHIVGGVSVPVVGAANQFDTRAFHQFLGRGGKTLVLEQTTLEPLGLGLGLSDKPATMAFPLQQSAPLWKSLATGDLSDWRGDNTVAAMQVRRPEAGGGRALAVTGGDAGLDLAPILDVPYGASGRVLLMQALAGTKRQADPAAHQVLQNAIDALADSVPASPPRQAVLVVASDTVLADRLRHLGLDVRTPSTMDSMDLDGVKIVAIQGTPQNLPSATALTAFLTRGGVVYWLTPDPASLQWLAPALGSAAGTLDVVNASLGTAMLRREDPLLEGVSREDLTYVQISSAWDRPMSWEADATDCLFLMPDALADRPTEESYEPLNSDLNHGTRGVVAGGHGVTLDRGGDMTVHLPAPKIGLYRVTVPALGRASKTQPPIVLVYVNDVFQTSFAVPDASWTQVSLVLSLTNGDNAVSLRFADGGGMGSSLTLGPLSMSAPLAYPEGVDVLTTPASLVTWRQGAGRVVLDGGSWLTNTGNTVRADRYANALFANLGAAFIPPLEAASSSGTAIPLASFHLVGDSPYYGAAPDQLTIRSNGTVESEFFCQNTGTFHVNLQGCSTPYQGTYCVVRVAIDGTTVGDVEIKSPTTATFSAVPVSVTAGMHRLDVSFINDASGGGEDRNLFLHGVSIGSGAQP